MPVRSRVFLNFECGVWVQAQLHCAHLRDRRSSPYISAAWSSSSVGYEGNTRSVVTTNLLPRLQKLHPGARGKGRRGGAPLRPFRGGSAKPEERAEHRPRGSYSIRSTSAGSMDAARVAGSIPATPAARTSVAMASARIRGFTPLMSYSCDSTYRTQK